MPKIISTLAIGGMVALSLVACSTPATSACAVTPSGSASSKVVVTGEVGAEPTVTIPAPLDAKVTERSVVTKGDGETAEDGEVVVAEYSIYNGATGALIESTASTGQPGKFLLDSSRPHDGLYKALNCSVEGERLVAVVPPSELFGPDGIKNQNGDYLVGPTDSAVFVFDITKVEPAPTESPTPTPTPIPHRDKADGTPVAPLEGFPTVTLAADGTPTITIPDTAPPTELKLETLIKGNGDTVPDGATVVVHYTGVNWTTGEVFDSSWTRGGPATFSTTQVIKGFSAAIVGQTVGSQVVVVIPPADGYGPNGKPPKISGTDVLVFVVDILGFAS